MSKRISIKEAHKKHENILQSQELNKQGIKPKISRAEKKRKMRLSKTQRFIEMLVRRGGHYKQKEFDENVGKDIVEGS